MGINDYGHRHRDPVEAQRAKEAEGLGESALNLLLLVVAMILILGMAALFWAPLGLHPNQQERIVLERPTAAPER
jgi:hypothetical protein